MPDAARPDTKTRIRDVARRLFAQHGYEAVSVRDIAEDVGVRPSAIYNHFPGKQALLADLMLTHMQRILPAMTQALNGTEDPAARLEIFARTHLAIHVDFKDDVFLAYSELRSLDPTTHAHLVGLRNEYEALLRKTLEDGATEGRMRFGHADVHARAILAMLTGITVWFREDGALGRDAVINSYVRATLQSVGLIEEEARK